MSWHPAGTGAIASPHSLANAAGAQILADGGNAIEAAVAASAVLAVVYPHFCGLGGDAIWMIADGAGKRTCLLGLGQAARTLPAITPDTPLPQRGPGSTLTTAGVVDAWQTALRWSDEHWGGTQALPTLLDPAIAHAEDGFALSASQAFWTDFRKAEHPDWAGFDVRFAGPDHIEGARFRQPELAASLRALSRDGLRSFYEGPLARTIASGLAACGSPLRAEDLAATRAEAVTPLAARFGAYELLAPPPPSQGLTSLQILSMLDRLGIAAHEPGSAQFYHLCVEAVKQAFFKRREIADPRFATDPSAAGLDEQNLDAMAAAISPDRALDWPHPYNTADTVFLAVADGKGRTVSILQSIYFDWGSGVTIGETGILWNNRGAAFSTRPCHPNAIAPGKRPFHTLNPGLALREGRPAVLYGTQGADGQPQTLSVLVPALIAHGLDPETALRLPRFLLGRTFSDASDSLKIEADLAPGVEDALAAKGHRLAKLPPLSPLAGQAGAIVLSADGTIAAAHDPRGDGGALFVPPVSSFGELVS